MNRINRIISVLLCASMIVSGMVFPVYAEDNKQTDTKEESKLLYTIEDELVTGMVYLDTSLISIKEDNCGDSFRIVNKSGKEGSVRLRLTDISASYGKDYVFYNGNQMLASETSDSVSLLDYMVQHADEMVEYNYSDAILDGSIIPDSVNNELSEEQLDAFEEAMPSLLKSSSSEVPKADGTKESLAAAFEAATGLYNDKTPLDGSQFALPKIEDAQSLVDAANELSNISIALNNPVIDISFSFGETEKIIDIVPIDNKESRIERRSLINLESDSLNVASTYASCTIELIDDEPEIQASLGFSQSSYNTSDNYVEISVLRSGDLSTMCSAHIYTQNITASSGIEYSMVDADLDFPMGIQKRTIRIPVLRDDLSKDVCFSVNLIAKSGCKIDNPVAICNIAPNEVRLNAPLLKVASKKTLLTTESPSSSIPVGRQFNLPQMYLSGDGNADNVMGWRLVADDDWFSSETSTVHFALSPSYAYNGFQIKWSRSVGTGRSGNTKFWIEGKDIDSKSAYDNLYNKGTSTWTDDTDSYYADNLVRIESLNFELDKESLGDTVYLYIHSISPILREFKVSLADYDVVKLLNEEGELVSCIDSGDYYKSLSTVQLSGSDSTGVLTTVASDSSTITISLPDTTDPIAYIKGVELVSADDPTKSHVIVDNLPMGLQSYSINFDNQFVFDNSGSYGLIKYVKDTENGYHGEFKIRPILCNIDAEISLEPSDYVNLTADETKLNRKGTAYVYHRGDYIGFDVSMKSGFESTYRCPSIFYTQGGPNSGDLSRAEVHEGKVGFRITRKEVNVSANVSAKNIEFLVKVATADISEFNPDSELFKYPKRVEGSYTYYIVADKDSFDASQMYELSVLPAENISVDPSGVLHNPDAVPVWTEPASGVSYTQNCIWLSGRADLPENNTIALTILTSHTYDVPLEGSVRYYDAADEAYAVGDSWMPAAGTVISTDEFHYGISKEDGSFSTIPIPIVNNAKKKYTIRYRVESYGNVSYHDVTLTSTVLSAIKRDGILHVDAASVPATPKNAPTLSSVTFERDGVLQTGVLINELKPTTLTVNIANSGISYTDPQGEIRNEKPSAVDILIYDSITKKQKGEAIPCSTTAAVANNAQWQAQVAVMTSQVDPDDLLFIRITTDKKCSMTNGGEIINQTVYAPVPVRARFIGSEYVSPVTQNFELTLDQNPLDLPLIGTLIGKFYIFDFVFSVDTSFKGITRFYIGNISAVSTDLSAALAGENYFPLDTLGQTAEQMTSGLSDIGDATGNIICGVPYWKVRAEAGLYFDFAAVSIASTSQDGSVVTSTSTRFVGAGGYFGIRNKVDFCYYAVILGWPCYMGGNIEFIIGAYLGAEAENVQNSTITPESLTGSQDALSNANFDAMVVAKLDTSLYAGVGICRVAGVRGVFSLTISFVSDPYVTERISGMEHTTGWNVSGSMDVILDMLLFIVPINVGSWSYLESGYFEDIRNLNTPKLMSLSSVSDDGSVAVYRKDRNEEESVWVANRRLLTSPGPGVTTTAKPLLDYSYDQPEPQLMHYVDSQSVDHALLVYLDDDLSRSDDERTALYYTICTNGNWTEPVMIQNDGTADFSPNLCDAGDDKILLSWTSRKNENSDGKISSLMSSMEVFTCFFDKTTGTFEEITQLTDDSYYDSAPIATCDSHLLVRVDQSASYLPASGNIVLQYFKAAVPEGIDTAADFISASLPLYNNAEPVYMLYDGNNKDWVTSYGAFELASGTDLDKFTSEWKGQRFLNASNTVFGINNPVISDIALGNLQYIALSNQRYSEICETSAALTEAEIITEKANATKNAAIFAYTIDSDRNLETGSDRELFIQLYDYKNRNTSYPIRITSNAAVELNPQIVSAYGTTWLFWLEEGGKICYMDISSALDRNIDDKFNLRENAKWEVQTVTSKECVDTGDTPCPLNYKAFGTEYGYLYVAWQQSVENGDNSQQALYVAARSYDTDTDSYSWSNASRISSSYDLSDLPTVAPLDSIGSSWLLVNNQSNLDKDGEISMSTKSSCLYAITMNPISRCDIDSISVETNPEIAIDTNKVNVTLSIVNNGLTASGAFDVNTQLIRNGDTEKIVSSTWTRADDEIEFSSGAAVSFPLHPGNIKKISQEFEIVNGANLTDYTLKISVIDKNSNVTSTDTFNLYEKGSFYEVSSINTKQKGDDFVLTAMVKNIGAEKTNASDVISVDYNDIYGLGTFTENFGSVSIGSIISENFDEEQIRGLDVGEAVSFELPLSISDAKLDCGYVNAKIGVIDSEGKQLGNTKTFVVSLENPYDITVNSTNKITLYEGQQINLNGSYKGIQRYVGGIFNYAVNDNSVAMTDGNSLIALAPGNTTLDISVEPFGGNGSVDVVILPASDYYPDGETIKKPDVKKTVSDCLKDPSCPLSKFKDMDLNEWYHDGIHYCVENGIMNGALDTYFIPDRAMTRAEAATVLWRMAGRPLVDYLMRYEDVETDAWYTEAVKWAASEKIILGYHDTLYGINDCLTREQFATMLYRYAQRQGDGFKGSWMFQLPYTDSADIAEWANEAAHWCSMKGIITGKYFNIFDPKGSATRAEAAAMLQRFCERDK